MWNVTYSLVGIGKGVSQNVQCHSLAVGHMKTGDETAFHKIWNTTHFLQVIGKDQKALENICNATHLLLVIDTDVLRFPLTKYEM